VEVIAKQKDPLESGDYLDGHWAWNQDVFLAYAKLRGAPPAAGVVTIVLEVADELTEHKFYVVAGKSGEVEDEIALNLNVSAGDEIRWKVTGFSGAPGQESTRLAISTGLFSLSGDPPTVDTSLYVQWRNQNTRIRLYDYDDAADAFTESESGIAEGKLVISHNPGNSIQFIIESSIAMEASSLKLKAPKFSETGVGLTAPWIEFRKGTRWICSLDKSGLLYVPHLVEADPAAAGGQFEFFTSGGTLTATLAPGAVTAKDYLETTL